MSIGCSGPATSYTCSEKSCTSASLVIAMKLHFSLACVLYSGSAILRGLPAWVEYFLRGLRRTGGCPLPAQDLGGQSNSAGQLEHKDLKIE